MKSMAALALLAMAVSTAACSGGQAATSATAHPSDTARASVLQTIPAVTPSSTPSPKDSLAVASAIGSPGPNSQPLAAGRWRTDKLHTPIEFSVQDGEWTAVADTERFAFLRRPAAGQNGLAFVWTENLFRKPCEQGWDGGTMPWPQESTPQQFFAWLTEESPIDFGSPEPTTIGSHDALSMERVIPDAAFNSCADEYFPMVDVAVEPPGDIGLPRYGQRFMLASVDVDEAPVLVLAFANAGPAFEEHKQHVAALLNSLEFGRQ